jgi:hypothetical protein
MPDAQGNDECSEWLVGTENQQLYDCKHWLLLALLLQTAKAVATAARALSHRVCVTRHASAPQLGLVSLHLHLSACFKMSPPDHLLPVLFCGSLFQLSITTRSLSCAFSQNDYIRKKNKWLKPIFDWVAAHGNEPIIPFSGAYESEVGREISLMPAMR